MTNNNYHEGYCRICNKFGKLTFEHIPPKSTLNNTEARVYTGDSFLKLMCDPNRYPWQTEGIKYKLLQKGLGDYTLCKSCNNITGELYGEEYKRWFYIALRLINENAEEHKKASRAMLHLNGVYPGRFIRQVLSIICSTHPEFTKKYPFVKDLILNKNYVFKEAPNFKIYMYLLKNPYNGYTGPMAIGFGNGIIKLINEIDLYPFGFLVNLSNEVENEADITGFINCSYDDVGEIDIPINVYEKNNIVPMDFRTKEEIIINSNDFDNNS
ncbi:MAG: hypothetical protein Q4E75_03845 [bacterium]|nr:hypothetical protein [bacterium]